MRVELINCEGAVLKCKINRFGISLSAFLLDGKGYIEFTPRFVDLYKYLLGLLTLESVLEASGEIKINNGVYDFKQINLKNIHSINKRITDHSEQDLDIRNMAKLIAKIESVLNKKKI